MINNHPLVKIKYGENILYKNYLLCLHNIFYSSFMNKIVTSLAILLSSTTAFLSNKSDNKRVIGSVGNLVPLSIKMLNNDFQV